MAFQQLPLSTVATLVAAGALLAVYMAWVLWTAFKGGWLATARGHLRGKVKVWRVPQSDMDRAVSQRMQETRLSNLHSVVGPLTHMLPFFCLGLALEVLSTGQLRDWPVVAVQLVSATLIFLLHICPQLISPKTLFPWQGVFFVLSSVLIMPGVCSPCRLSLVGRLSELLITASNCVLLHTPTAVAQHGLYLIVAFIALNLSPYHAEDISQHVGTEFVAATVSCLCVAVMQRLVEAQLRSHLQAECLAEKQMANNKLLSVFYEVVVEVDSELAIVSSDPDLGLFLPHSAGCPIPDLLGTKLDELLPDDQDRQLLLQRTLCAVVGEDSSVEVIHSRMGYSGNDPINVELFSLRFRGLMGRERHLLGVREFGDQDQRRDWSCMTLQIDAFDPDLAIMDISPNLQRELGGVELGTSLGDVVLNGENFHKQLQQAFNTLACDDALEPSYSFRAVLRPLGQNVQLLASCCATMDASSPEPLHTMSLSFSHLAPLHQGSFCSSGSGSSRGSSRGSSPLRGTRRQQHRRRLAPSPRATRLGSAMMSL